MDLLLQIALFFALALLLYRLDASLGVPLYRWWYGMTHPEALPPGQERGLLWRQPLYTRLAIAGGTALVLTLISLLSGRFFADTTRVLLNLLSLAAGLAAGWAMAPRLLPRLQGWIREKAMEESSEGRQQGHSQAAAPQPRQQRQQPSVAQPEQQQPTSPQAAEKPAQAPQTSRQAERPAPPAQPRPGTAPGSAEPSHPASGEQPGQQDTDWRQGVRKFLDKR
jgi:hypothetical protein